MKKVIIDLSKWGGGFHLRTEQQIYQWRIQNLWKGRAGNLYARPEKGRSAGGGGGGLRHIPPPPPPLIFVFWFLFVAAFTLWGAAFTVRLPDRPPGWKERRKKKTAEKGGGGEGPRPIRPPPPPWIRHCIQCVYCAVHWFENYHQ